MPKREPFATKNKHKVIDDNDDNKTTRILQHEISYYWIDNDDLELDEADIEHIENAIKAGCNQGELCQTTIDETDEARGWWKIA